MEPFEKLQITLLALSKLPYTFIIGFDSNLNIVLAEGEEFNVISISNNTIVGKSAKDVLPKEFYDFFHTASKQIMEGIQFESEFQYNDNYYQCSGSILSRELNYGILISRNITSEKRTRLELLLQQKELQRNKDRLELVLEGTRLGMWDWNPQTNEVRFNERWAEMLGYDFSEIEHNLSTWETKVHPDDIAGCFADITAHMEGKVSFYENIHRMKHKNGSWVYILDRGKIVERDKDGKPIRFTGTHTDLTPLKTAELKAKEALEAKSFFLASMSHEIRTPLHGILGINNLLQNISTSDEMKKYTTVIEDCGQSLLIIINDILDFSKIEAGKLELANAPFSIHELLHSIRTLYSENFIAKGLYLEVEFLENVPNFIYSDLTRIRQILSNLINNAIKFTSHGGVKITVSSEKIDTNNIKMIFSVKDTGIGISPKNLDKIFDKFTQEDNSISRKFGGTGLGLSICKLLVELLQGKIWVDSEINEGSTFHFSITTKEVKKPIQETKKVEAEKLPPLKFLIAEDNEVNQMYLTAILSILGYNAKLTKNGLEALTELQKEKYDVLLTDIHMPEMNGFELTKNILELYPNKKNRPLIVALSADSLLDSKQKAFKAGMDDYLSKPFRKQDVENLIRSHFVTE